MSSISLEVLLAELDAFVDPHRIPDLAPTGLQVDGTGDGATVAKVALGESANLALFREAAAWGAQVVLVHHGLFWASEDPEHDPARALDERRAAFLHQHGMALIAYHLPLDAHAEVGNNAEIARRLGLTDVVHDFGDLPETEAKIGVTGRFRPPIGFGEILLRAEDVFAHPIAAIERGVDAFLTGEGREWVPAVAEEAGIAFLAVGHHASEVFGVQALGQWVERRFGVETRFFPQSNPF